jgi:hypothetical protein
MNPKFKINGKDVNIHIGKDAKSYIKGYVDNEWLEGEILDKEYWKSDKINLKIMFQDQETIIKEYNFFPRELGLGDTGSVLSCDSLWWETDDFSGRFWKDRNTDLFYFTTLTFENSDIINLEESINRQIFIQNPDNDIYIGENV